MAFYDADDSWQQRYSHWQSRRSSTWSARSTPAFSPTALLAEWHVATLQLLAAELEKKYPEKQFDGLTVNKCLCLLRGYVSNKVRNKIQRLDAAYSLLRHLTPQLCHAANKELYAELMKPAARLACAVPADVMVSPRGGSTKEPGSASSDQDFLDEPSFATELFDIYDKDDVCDQFTQTATVANCSSLVQVTRSHDAGIQVDKVTSEKCVGSNLVLFQLASRCKSDADTQTFECEISTEKKPPLVCSRSVQTASLPRNRKCRTNGRAVQTACGPALCEFSCQTDFTISLSQSPRSSNVGSMPKLPRKEETPSVLDEFPSQEFLVLLLREFSRAWPWAFKQLDCDGVIRQFKRYIVEISSHDVAYSDLRGDALNARITALLHDRQ
eukprot:TRINITY_DN18540_c0_g1_i5.p1 TRINITY_DN18540_c0_g1~~TRINITY_DN18540_c0_g1_i5.p1  ORF type:complete len:384 (-),score=63.91 TRINITY_DN18540_c0_g1_i5:26-1177(-)